ncbi:MAG: hypothetical protein AAFO95_09660 [Cyanobacteria bacterium J06600_6]
MKISTVAGTITVIVTSIVGFLAHNPAIAQWTPNNSLVADESNSRLNLVNQPGDRHSNASEKETTISPAVRTSKKTAVMYIKDETLDTGNLLEAMENQNVEIGFAEEGEEVTIIEQTEKMQKVRFNETGRLGWISRKSLAGL